MNRNALKKQCSLWGVLLSLLVASTAFAASEVDLQLSPEVSATAKGHVKMPKQQERMALNYVNQPPMVPHSVDGYQISKNTNRCLQCHGIEHYRTTGAPRVSPTHFMDSSGKVLGDVAPRRYFCLQCHVPQTNAAPIIGNNFQPMQRFAH